MATTKDKFVSDEKFKNYVSLVVALKFTKDGLKDYVQNEISKFYVRLSNRCAGFLPCNISCTKTNPTKDALWCDSCKKWRSEFRRHMRYPGQVNRVKWEMFDSRTWGRDSTQYTINQIMNVYVHQCRDPTESTMDDMINIVSLFENCLYFDIGNNKQLLGKVRIVRNQYFAHNKTFMIEEKDLRQCLETLISVLQEKSIKHNEKCKEAVHILLELKTKNRFQNNHVLDLQQVIEEKNRENTSTKIEKYFQEKDKRYSTETSVSTWLWFIWTAANFCFLTIILCFFTNYIYKKRFITYSPINNKGKKYSLLISIYTFYSLHKLFSFHQILQSMPAVPFDLMYMRNYHNYCRLHYNGFFVSMGK